MITEKEIIKAEQKPKYVLFRHRKNNSNMTEREKLINDLKKQKADLLSQSADKETKTAK